MLGIVILLALLYLCICIGFRMGKTVGRGAERWEFQQQADRNGGYLFLGQTAGARTDDQPLRGA